MKQRDDIAPHAGTEGIEGGGLKRLGREATACFQEPYDPHYSARGHLVVADALAVSSR